MRWAKATRTTSANGSSGPVVACGLSLEKLEFLFDTTYYLQAGLFVIGTLSWLASGFLPHSRSGMDGHARGPLFSTSAPADEPGALSSRRRRDFRESWVRCAVVRARPFQG